MQDIKMHSSLTLEVSMKFNIKPIQQHWTKEKNCAIDCDDIFYPGSRKSFYDHLSLLQIKAYDKIITCSYVSHWNVLAGKIVT